MRAAKTGWGMRDRNRRCSGLWAFAALLLLALPARAQQRLEPGQPIPPLELERFLDGAAADGMATSHINGLTVAIVQNGSVSLLKGYGSDGTRPVDPARSLFRIGSISKTFTWISLLQQVERGRIRLDAPVNDYLPDALKFSDQGFAQPIRIRDLLSHASGLADTALGHLMVDKGERVMPLADYLARYRPARAREPGLLSSYSNYGAALAGYIVARVTGDPDVETMIEREVLTPLGLHNTTLREPYAARAGLPAPMPAQLAAYASPGFMWDGSSYRRASYEFISQAAPAGAMSSTAADMARYMLVQLQDGRLDDVQLYGPATAQALRTPIFDAPPGNNGWAHGLQVLQMPGGFAGYGHDGAVPTSRSNMVLVPELGLGVFVAGNTGSSGGFAARLPKLLIERFYAPATMPPQAAKGDPELLKIAGRYEGPYRATRRPYGGLEMFLHQFDNSDSVSISSAGYLVTRSGGSVRRWVPDGKDGLFRAVDGTQHLQFKFDAAGNAVSYAKPDGFATMERQDSWRTHATMFLFAELTVACALFVWIAALVRWRTPVEATKRQVWQHRQMLLVAALWLLAIGLFADFISGVSDTLMFRWPVFDMQLASSLALAAGIGSVALLLQLKLLGGGGWTMRRKALHGLAVCIFVAFTVLLGLRGGLLPWA
jgi:CubicO group peptidase (beta-lactamase class C family)